HTNRPLTDFGGKTSIFSHSVYLFLREFSLQDSRGGSVHPRKRTYGYSTRNEHMPEAHRQHATWTPERLLEWAG
ncbi:hypothetical protein FCZ44_30385, partial [Escherichia coli]|nr:hypothetical protein [Escherichia coli]